MRTQSEFTYATRSTETYGRGFVAASAMRTRWSNTSSNFTSREAACGLDASSGGGMAEASMPAHGNLKDEDIKTMIQWISTSAN